MPSPLSDYFKFSILGGKGQNAGGILTGGRGGNLTVPNRRLSVSSNPNKASLASGQFPFSPGGPRPVGGGWL